MFQNTKQPSFSTYHPPLFTGSRNTHAEPDSCSPILFAFLPGFLWSGVHRLGSKCWLFLPQILTLITGKVTNVRRNMDQEDGFLQWRWQSEPSGEKPPSTGMELFPFSKEKARMCNEVSEWWDTKINLGGDHFTENPHYILGHSVLSPLQL